jgi:hypothetical protein
LKEQILSHERTVLQTIAFDLTIEHPYKFLLTYVKNIQGQYSILIFFDLWARDSFILMNLTTQSNIIIAQSLTHFFREP